MRTPTYYLHIGMHKSASTYIQQNIFDGLAKRKRILYADPYMLLGVPAINEEPVVERVHKVRTTPYYMLDGGFRDELRLELAEVLARHGIESGKVVISNEYFSGAEEHNFFLDVNAVLALRELFGASAKVLLIIRRQDDFLESWYANSIRGGRWEPLHQAFNYYDGQFGDWKPSYRINIDVKNIDYHRYVTHLEALFGADNVTVIPFELLKEDPARFNAAVLSYLGEEGAPTGTAHVNAKFPYATLWLTRYLNRFTNNGRNPLVLLPQRPFNVFFRRYAMREYHQRPAWVRRAMWWSNNMTYVNALYPIGRLVPVTRRFITDDMRRKMLAIASGLPRSMSGSFDVQTWSPTQLGAVDDDYLGRLATLYRSDGALHGRFEAAMQQQETVGEEPMAGQNARRGGIAPLMRAAARILRQENGPNIAEVEFSGWDTHANQGLAGGALDRLLGQLAEGMVTLRTEMGSAWSNTTVVVMTEFGRTARPNGTRGTDHGTAGAGFLLGPQVARSRVFADWPGLGDGALFEGRDVKPTLDTRAVLKAAIAGTFDLTPAQADRVFPSSERVRGAYDLMS